MTLKELGRKYYTFWAYILINGILTASYIVLYDVWITFSEVNYAVANSILYVLTTCVAYILTKRIAFLDTKRSIRKVVYFVCIRILMAGISTFIIWVIVEMKISNEYAAQIISTLLTFLLSYFLNKKIFRSRTKEYESTNYYSGI